MNNQPIEKLSRSDGSVLDVHSIFLTIQGEGVFTGHPAVFIRLAGCNLMCPKCDTDYTVGRKTMQTSDLAREVIELKGATKLVVITGGEPFRQNISKLCNSLVENGLTVQVETNGTLPIPEQVHESVVIVVSPKTHHVHESVVKRAACVKYVLGSTSVGIDGLPNRVLGNSCQGVVKRLKMLTYIQPEDSKDLVENHNNLRACVNSSLSNGHILQIQMHKIIGVD